MLDYIIGQKHLTIGNRHSRLTTGLLCTADRSGWHTHTRGQHGTTSLSQRCESSSANFPNLGVRSPGFLTKKWPLKILTTFPT